MEAIHRRGAVPCSLLRVASPISQVQGQRGGGNGAGKWGHPSFAGKWDAAEAATFPFAPQSGQTRNVPISGSRSRPSVLEPERSGSRLFNKSREPHPFGGWPAENRPSLSRTRLSTLPFFCLSVSGRKLAPSAPSSSRVSRTESGQLASGWHHSSPFRTVPENFHDPASPLPENGSAPDRICSCNNDVGHFLQRRGGREGSRR